MKSIARVALGLGVLALLASPAVASTLTIQFSGLNLYYDGQDVVDNGSVAVGGGIDGWIDPLATMSFFNDGSLLGVQTTDIYADVLIAGVGPILAGGDHKVVNPTSAAGFDLWVGAGGIALNWDSPVTLDYNGGDLTFLGSATTSSIVGQLLPYGMVMGTPVTVSFSTQVTLPVDDQSMERLNGDYVRNFTSFGTGEVSGPSANPVPEPATLLTIGVGLVGGGLLSRRRRKN